MKKIMVLVCLVLISFLAVEVIAISCQDRSEHGCLTLPLASDCSKYYQYDYNLGICYPCERNPTGAEDPWCVANYYDGCTCPGVVPEFSTYGIIAGVAVIGAVVFWFVKKKKKVQ